MFSALAERRRLEKINISERALRGKFSFRNFSVNTEKILKEVLRKKTLFFFASSTALHVLIFSRRTTRRERREQFATGSWITLIISQTQWQEMFSALAERRRLEKINISERALRGKFFEIFSVNTEKILKEVLRKKTSYFFASSTVLLHVDFSRRTTRRERREHFCHWVVNNPDNFTDPVARNVLCARWEAPSRKINISERALRGKFFSKFFREYGKNPEGSSSKENFIFLRVLLLLSSCWFFRDARLAGSAENIFLPLGRE